VAAAVTDSWGAAKRGFARLLGRGDAQRLELAEQRLEQMRGQLAGAPAAELERVQAELEVSWRTRLLDLLKKQPATAADLQALVGQVRALLEAETVSAVEGGVAAGRDVTITASGGGVAAGTIKGDVAPGNPTVPDPARR
jgi:hypothetical protein